MAYKYTHIGLEQATNEILSLMGENKNPITGEGADNKSTDNG